MNANQESRKEALTYYRNLNNDLDLPSLEQSPCRPHFPKDSRKAYFNFEQDTLYITNFGSPREYGEVQDRPIIQLDEVHNFNGIDVFKYVLNDGGGPTLFLVELFIVAQAFKAAKSVTLLIAGCEWIRADIVQRGKRIYQRRHYCIELTAQYRGPVVSRQVL